MTRFFNRNDSIENLTILFNVEDSLSFIAANGIRLKKLSVRLNQRMSLEYVVNFLKQLCDTTLQIERVGLIIEESEILANGDNFFCDLRSLQSLYMKRCVYDWAENCPVSIREINVLHLEKISFEDAERISIKAEYLAEIYLEEADININIPFARNSSKLRKIVFQNAVGSLVDFDWIEVRSSLDLAQKLDIYIQEKAYIQMTAIIPKHNELINFKRSEEIMPYCPC